MEGTRRRPDVYGTCHLKEVGGDAFRITWQAEDEALARLRPLKDFGWGYIADHRQF